MSERTFKKLAEVQEAIDLKDYVLAHKLLRVFFGGATRRVVSARR